MDPLHITSGDCAGGLLAKAGLPGEVFVWHDVCYDGPRTAGWPTPETIDERVAFLHRFSAGGLGEADIRRTFEEQYALIAGCDESRTIVLWFDACLFDMSMLAHLLSCLADHEALELLVIDAQDGIEPYNGLGQLSAEQLAARYSERQPVTPAQRAYACRVDAAFAAQDFGDLAEAGDAPLPWMPAAIARWLDEQPGENGFGRLATLCLDAVGPEGLTPGQLFGAVAAADPPPQYWGDTTLWAVANELARRGHLRIEGPAGELPQWPGGAELSAFRILPA